MGRAKNNGDAIGRVVAIARCCEFVSNDTECQAQHDEWVHDLNGVQSTTCSDLHADGTLDARFTELMGCQGWSNGSTLDGHWFNSIDSSDIVNDADSVTQRQFDGGCSVQNGNGTGSRNNLNCCYSPETTFDCNVRYGIQGNVSIVSCDSDYTMVGCSAFSNDSDLNSYYINDFDECYASIYEGSTGAGVVANALCCKEITSSPTTEPTTEPTFDPTIEPTKVPTVEPTNVPTTEPTSIPTSIPSTHSPTTDQPTSKPTTHEPTVVLSFGNPTQSPTDTDPGVQEEVEVVAVQFNSDVPLWIWVLMAALIAICISCLIVAVSIYRREEKAENTKNSLIDVVAAADLDGDSIANIQMSGKRRNKTQHRVRNESSTNDWGRYGMDDTPGHQLAPSVDDELYDPGQPELVSRPTSGQSTSGGDSAGGGASSRSRKQTDHNGYIVDDENEDETVETRSSDHEVIDDIGIGIGSSHCGGYLELVFDDEMRYRVASELLH